MVILWDNLLEDSNSQPWITLTNKVRRYVGGKCVLGLVWGREGEVRESGEARERRDIGNIYFANLKTLQHQLCNKSPGMKPVK